MVTPNSRKFTRTFIKPKFKEKKEFRKTTISEEEILKLRKELGIDINDKSKYHMGGLSKGL